VENHVQEQEDHEEHHGQNDLHTFLRPKLKFIFARPLIGVSRGQLQLLPKHLARLVGCPLAGCGKIDS
jgi:ABC-type Zn2+ transport system substrate-binding protein/surface adhesin